MEVTSSFDKENPHSLYNMLSSGTRLAIDAIPEEILTMTINELEKHMPRGHFTEKEIKLRANLWREYEVSQSTGRNLQIDKIVQGVMTRKTWYEKIWDKYWLTFMLTPPETYTSALKDLLDKFTKEMFEIVKMPLYDPDTGKPLPAVATMKLKALEMIDNRLHGAYVQKIEQKSVTMNLNQSNQKQIRSMEDVDAELKRLESKANHEPIIEDGYETAITTDGRRVEAASSDEPDSSSRRESQAT